MFNPFKDSNTRRLQHNEQYARRRLKEKQASKPGPWTGPNAKGPGTLSSSSTNRGGKVIVKPSPPKKKSKRDKIFQLGKYI